MGVPLLPSLAHHGRRVRELVGSPPQWTAGDHKSHIIADLKAPHPCATIFYAWLSSCSCSCVPLACRLPSVGAAVGGEVDDSCNITPICEGGPCSLDSAHCSVLLELNGAK